VLGQIWKEGRTKKIKTSKTVVRGGVLHKRISANDDRECARDLGKKEITDDILTKLAAATGPEGSWKS